MWQTVLTLCLLLSLVACGNGDQQSMENEAAQTLAESIGQEVRPAAIDPRRFSTRRALAGHSGAVVPPEATELFDFAEAGYRNLFPSHQVDQLAGDYAYRYYPETGIFLIVSKSLQVYVMGGDLGSAAYSVGAVTDYLPPITYSLSGSLTQVPEGQMITCTVTSSRKAARSTNITFSLIPGDPMSSDQGSGNTNSNDFPIGGSGPVTYSMDAGQTSVSYSVTPLLDNISEQPETFAVKAVVAGTVLTVSTTVVDDAGSAVVVLTGSGNYRGGAGHEIYVVSAALMADANATIVDAEGSNKIQLSDGLQITTSAFASNAVLLTLSNGANLTVLNASGMLFDVGANASTGDLADAGRADLSYSRFAALLGISAVPTGSAIANGTPNYIVPTSVVNSFVSVLLPTALTTVTATAAREEFIFDYKIINGRATRVSGEITINGFSSTLDKLVFRNINGGPELSKAQFLSFPGVILAENPFANQTTIALDSEGGIAGGITLNGIKDATLESITVEIR